MKTIFNKQHQYVSGVQEMIKAHFGEYDGDGWEETCQLFLKRKYDSEGYQEMPAHTKGDLGIEGFTRTGIVFQCYCPDEEYETKKLYEAQRAKITNDLVKLRKNKKELQRFIGDIKIRQWIFLTPKITNKEVVAHCQIKALEYRSDASMKDLLDDDFDVFAKDEGFFLQEIIYIKMLLETKFSLHVDATSQDEVFNWKECESESIKRLYRKISKLFDGLPKKVELTNKYIDIIVRNFIKGQKILNELRGNHPLLFEKLLSIKSSLEEYIEQELLTTSLIPKDFIKEVKDKYKMALESEKLSRIISFGLSEDLTKEIEADWLVRCPLDFGDD